MFAISKAADWICQVQGGKLYWAFPFSKGSLAGLLHYTSIKRIAKDKQSILLGSFINYEENKVLWIRLLALPTNIRVEWSNKFLIVISLLQKINYSYKKFYRTGP